MATIYGEREFTDDEAQEAIEKLKDAMDGFGTNEEAIVEVLVNLNNKQRMVLKEKYAVAYGEPLMEQLISELTGDLEDTIVGMMLEPRHYDAKLLYEAMKGAGTDEATLVGILCTRNNSEIEEIKEIYKTEYENELQDDIRDDVGGNLGKLLFSITTGGRNECEGEDEDEAEEDAQKLVDAGVGQLGTDELDFNSVLCLKSYEQLRAVFRKYKEKQECCLSQHIDSEMSGDLRDGYLAIVKITEDMPGYFAERLNNTMAGLGTNDDELIRLLISRSENHLYWIKQRYQEMYGTSLYDAVASECSSHYKRCLLSLIEGKYVGPDA